MLTSILLAMLIGADLYAPQGRAFYLPIPLERAVDERVVTLDVSVRLTPPDGLRIEYLSSPRRCLGTHGRLADGLVRAVVVCDGQRRISGPLASFVMIGTRRGITAVDFVHCRLGETPVGCPPTVTVEVR